MGNALRHLVRGKGYLVKYGGGTWKNDPLEIRLDIRERFSDLRRGL